jgi:drug/metabolite transporter (DMT)-like permease
MSNISERQRGILEMVAAMFLMGTVGYFVVEAKQEAHNVVFFRCLFGTIFLTMYCLFTGLFKNTGLNRKKLFMIVLSGVFLVCNWIMLFASFKSASISTSTVIYHVQPFFFVIIWAAVLRESVPKDKIIWMVVAFIGVTLVANVDQGSFSFSSAYLKGILLALSAAVFWATSAVIVKQLKGVRPHLVALTQLAIGTCILLPFANMENMSSATNVQWGYLVILGGVHSCLTYILMYSAYQKLSTPVIAVLTFLYPVVAILVDFIFYHKSLSPLQFVGVFLIMFSSFAVNQNIPLILRKWIKV